MLISEIVNGPMVWFSFVCFFSGTLYQIVKFYFFSRSKARYPKKPSLKQNTGPHLLDGTSMSYRFAMFKLTVFGRHPGMMTLITIFHLPLLATPFFALVHNVLLHMSIGLYLPSLPEPFTDLLSITVIACCSFFLFRRLFNPKVRAIIFKRRYEVQIALKTCAHCSRCTDSCFLYRCRKKTEILLPFRFREQRP